MMLLQLAFRELWGSKKQISIPALALALAVASFFILSAFQFKIDEMIRMEGRNSLGADLQIRATREIAESEMAAVKRVLPEATAHTSIVDFNTMLHARDSNKARFVRLYVVEDDYPFYGQYRTQPELSFKDLSEKPGIVMPADVAEFLEVDVGDLLEVGEAEFYLAAILIEKPGGVISFINFAPTVFMHRRHLARTQLFDTRGRIDYMSYFKLPAGSAPPSSFVEPLEEALGDPIFQVRSYDESDRGFQRLYNQLQLFGEIVAVMALLIASFSIFGSLQTWFFERRYLIAILRSSGASSKQIHGLLSLASLILAGGSSLVGLVLGYLGQWTLTPLLEKVVKLPEGLGLPVRLYLVSLVVGVVSTFLFSLFAMTRVVNYKPLLLIRSKIEEVQLSREKAFFSFLILSFFFALSWYFTGSFREALVLISGLVIALLLGVVVSFGLFGLVAKIDWGDHFAWLYASRSLLREKQSALVSASVLFLVSCLLAVLFTMEHVLQKEFRVDPRTRASTLFVFDVGDQEQQPIEQFLQKYNEVHAVWAPWLTIRWIAKNQGPTITNPDVNLANNIEFRVSVVSELLPNEDVVAGRMWTKDYSQDQDYVEMSVASTYADRVGIELGDILTFNLYGVEFDAKVTNLRRIRFTDFQPAFRFAFQKGFFEELPFSYLASIETPDDQSRISVLNEFIKAFPGISIVDLSQVKKDLMAITSRISIALRVILGFLLLVGMSLMGALAREKVSNRKFEFANLKTMGASQAQLRGILSIEFFLISLLPTIAGSGLAVLMANVILWEYFAIYQFQWSGWVLSIPIAISLLMLIVGNFAAWGLAQVKPRLLLAEAT